MERKPGAVELPRTLEDVVRSSAERSRRRGQVKPEIFNNVWTGPEDDLAFPKRVNRKVKEATGMQIAPERFHWEEWLPILRKLLWLGATVLGTFAAGSIEEGVKGDLKTSEATAGIAAKTEIALQDETQNLSDAIDYYTRREIACDLAIETFARHRGEDEDWNVVVEECHSKGGTE